MLIKLLCGTYGAREGNVIIAKTSNSEPFEVEEKRAEQMIAAGYARKAGNEGNFITEDSHAKETEEIQPAIKEEDVKDITEYSLQDLRKRAKELGLPITGSKQQIIERIQEAENKKLSADGQEEENTEDSEEEPPILAPAEPEV